jgi:hypothetical protein
VVGTELHVWFTWLETPGGEGGGIRCQTHGGRWRGPHLILSFARLGCAKVVHSGQHVRPRLLDHFEVSEEPGAFAVDS